jgi:hypothetical protein
MMSDITFTYICSTCGSTDITSDAVAIFDVSHQDWILSAILDNTDCQCCGETKPLMAYWPLQITKDEHGWLIETLDAGTRHFDQSPTDDSWS